jgi:Ca2+-binding EF-hand superfamily protein
MIASLIHAGARLDRDDNHVKENSLLSAHKFFSFSQPSAFYEKLFNNLSIVIMNQIRLLSNINQPYPNNSV